MGRMATVTSCLLTFLMGRMVCIAHTNEHMWLVKCIMKGNFATYLYNILSTVWETEKQSSGQLREVSAETGDESVILGDLRNSCPKR